MKKARNVYVKIDELSEYIKSYMKNCDENNKEIFDAVAEFTDYIIGEFAKEADMYNLRNISVTLLTRQELG